METYLGMDFGGTKLLIGEVDALGHVLRSKCYVTAAADQRQAVKILRSSLEDYQNSVGYVGTPAAVGVGIVGIVDYRSGQWISMCTGPENEPIPLAEMIGDAAGIPCFIENDVRSSAMAELLLGQGRYTRDFIYLNVGTGLAAGFVVDGHLIHGANMGAGEVGHMVVNLTDTLPCGCGRRGCAENVVSGIGFSCQAEHYGLNDLINPENGRVDSMKLFDRAERGDETCEKIIDQAACTLACVIMNLVRVTDPDTIIYGGGILSDDRFLLRVKSYLEENTMEGVRRGLIPSTFNSREAGLLGAASLAMDNVWKERRNRDAV